MTGHSVPKHDVAIINGRPADLQPLPVIDPVRWEGQPVPQHEWLVRDLVPLETTSLLSGHGGGGKSTLMLQLLVCASIGLPWLGFETRRVNCTYFSAEDPGKEIHIRLAAVLRHYGREFGDLENLALLDRVDEPGWLMEWGAIWESGRETALYHQLERHVLDRGTGLLVIDSLYSVFPGSKLEERHAWEFMSMLGRLARCMKGSVVVIFHPSKSGLSSGEGDFGSVGWHNACRSRLYFTSPKDDGADVSPDLRELRVMKQNFAARAAPIKLEWKDGAFARVDQPAGVFSAIEKRTAEAAILDGIAALATAGVTVSHGRTAPNYAARVIVKTRHGRGRTVDELDRALWRLIEAGKVRSIEEGPPSRRRSHLVVASSDEGE